MNQTRSTNTTENQSSKVRFILPWIVLILTFMTYSRTLTFSFLHDDAFHIFGDPRLESWGNGLRIFTEHLWSPIQEQGNYYRPVILIWFLIQKTLFDLDPALWHFASVCLHVGVTVLVYRLALVFLKNILPAAGTALVFGLHPVHIESVSWLSASVDPLMSLFLLSSYLCFFRCYEAGIFNYRNNSHWLFTSLLLYALAQLTKETAIIFPALILSTAFFSKSRLNLSLKPRLSFATKAMLPFALVAGLYLAVRISILGTIADNVSEAPLRTLLLTLPGVIVKYIQQLLIPIEISPYYDIPFIDSFTWSAVGIPLIVCVIFAVGLIYWGTISKSAAIAITWIVCPILPVLNLFLLPVADRFHDRFLYLSSVGFALLIGLILTQIKETDTRVFGFPISRVIAIIILCTPLALGTVYQSSYWKSNLSYFERAALISPGNDDALNNFAKELIQTARIDEAEIYLKKVINRSPNHAMSLFNLGKINFIRSDYEAAKHYYLSSLKFAPYDPDIHTNIGYVYAHLGNSQQAEKSFRASILYSRGRSGYQIPLGVFLRAQGRFKEALEIFKSELQLNPNQADIKQAIVQLETKLKQ